MTTNQSDLPKPGNPRPTAEPCLRCRMLPPGRYHRADGGGRVCDDCFRFLARSPTPAAGDPRFSCAACGTAHPAAHLVERVGLSLCPACLQETRSGRADVAEDSAAASAATDAQVASVATVDGESGEAQTGIPGLARATTCPHCWHVFAPQDVLWVSQHSDLIGDPIAGPEAQLRFLPSRFDANGDALDLLDMPCQQLACPRCHLAVPRGVISAPPLFLSIIGSPASGKSHFLAAMTWQLRQQLPLRFGLEFGDADTVSNQVLNQYEQSLFMADDQERPTALRKTELHGELYSRIQIGDHAISLPRPFLFTLRSGARSRVVCLYDNAGEHFQPGMDTSAAPGTRHLARSAALMFLFDPTQHPRFRERCRAVSRDPQILGAARAQRQEIVMTEAAERVRRHRHDRPNKKHDRPMVVVVSKADVWGPLVGADLTSEPFVADAAAGGGHAVDLGRVDACSKEVRSLLLQHAPEFVAAAEGFCQEVVYIPVSALGRAPRVDEATGLLGVPPAEIAPRWATVPMLYTLARWSGLVGGRREGGAGASERSTRPPEAVGWDGDS